MRPLLLLFALLLAFGCAPKEEHVHTGEPQYYSCSMHPEVMRTAPGDCPICGMTLTPVGLGSRSVGEGMITRTYQQLRLGNITMDTARIRAIGDELLLTGTVALDRERTATISSRVMGRVDRLHIKTPGERVAKGQPLYAIYSEELQTAIAELQLGRTEGRTGLAGSARERLMAFGLGEQHIAELEQAGNVPLLVDIPAPEAGVVTAVLIREGDRVMQGAAIFDVASIADLWVQAQAYPADLQRLSTGMPATVRFPARPERVLTAAITFIGPELAGTGVVNLVRLNVPNADGGLQPGMQAVVAVPVDAKQALALPVGAVLRDGRDASVWLATGGNNFKNVMVSTGVEAQGYVEITAGIKPGDVVVVTGAYLVNSEYIFKQGADPMAGMQH